MDLVARIGRKTQNMVAFSSCEYEDGNLVDDQNHFGRSRLSLRKSTNDRRVNNRGVNCVLHEERFEILRVVDEERLEAVRQHELHRAMGIRYDRCQQKSKMRVILDDFILTATG
jgi:hypothetical protein